MTTNISESETRLRELVAKASKGEDVVLAFNDMPVAKIVPIQNVPDANDGPPAFPSFQMGLIGSLPTRAEIADEMFDRSERE